MIDAKEDTRWCLYSSSSFENTASVGEFPIRDDIAQCESGHGYVLRMAVANFLCGLPTVKKMLGKTRFSVLEDVDASQIANWFGANPEKLSIALGATGIGNSANDFEFCGHLIGRSYFVNRMYPRVCALCLVEAPYCRNQWELALVTACPLHGVTLIDSCPWCGKSLSWNRPAVTNCMCGGSLALVPNACDSTELESGISQWIASKLNPLEVFSGSKAAQKTEEVSRSSTLLRLLKPLSLGGGMQLIYALGTAERSDACVSYVSQRKKSSIVSARDMLFQADSMVEKLMAGKNVEFRKSNFSVVVNLLAETSKANADAADRSLAHSLIYVLLRQGGRSNWKSRHPQLSQYELF